MAQSYTTQDGVTLIIPGAYASVTVLPGQSNTAAAGVVTLIGEADEGEGFLDEANLGEVAFTPDQYGRVLQKYGSGRIVDSFRSIVAAANDPNILGGVSLVRIIKTNQSVAAANMMSRAGFGNYAEISAKKFGLPGNLIRRRSEVYASEIAPITSAITVTPHLAGTVDFEVRMNGAVPEIMSMPAKFSPTQLASDLENVDKGIMATGGSTKWMVPGAVTLSASPIDADTLLVTLQAGSVWTADPEIGDTAFITANGDYTAVADSAVAGGSGENVGSYIVMDFTNTLTSATMTLKRIHTNAAIVPASGTTGGTGSDIICFNPIVIANMTGQDRGSAVGITGTYNCTLNDGTNISLAAPSGEEWAAQPKANDILTFNATFAGITAGFYKVISATSSEISAVRLSDYTAGTTGSQAVAVPPTLATQPFKVLSPVIDGMGKTLTVEGAVDAIFKKADGSVAGLSNAQLISASEYRNQMTYSKGNFSESFRSGGEIVFRVGCTEVNATMEVLADKIEFKVNSVLRFTAPFSQFKTLNDLVLFVSSQTNFSAQLGLARHASINPNELDKGVYTISGLASHKNGRIKRDAADFAAQNAASTLVSIDMQEEAGLPEAESDVFLTGGAKGGTTSAMVTTAIDACEKLDTNFIVPLFSVNATEDITNEETEATSTYSIDAINAYVKSHVLKMSQIKMRKNRMAIVSKRGSYSDIKEAAGEMASSRVGMCFQDVKNVSSDGQIKQFQPWMASIIATGMQAAAGYKGIVKKFANVSGIISPMGDFDPNNPGDAEDALKAGLMFMERVPTGGFRWVSDQLTYSVDNNFVYNSFQAVYIADLITLTLIERFDRLVVGKSVAEISAATALSILETEMFNFKRLRWIAASDDAPKGYKNASAKINGPVCEINCEIKLAGLIYFVPIYLTVSQVSQTAEG